MFLIQIAAMAVGFTLLTLHANCAPQGTSDKKGAAVDERLKAAVEAWIDRAIAADAPKDAPPWRIPRKVEALDNEHVRKAFADDRFYSVHAKKMPRPDMVPKPLRTLRLVRVPADGSVHPIEDLEGLKSLLCAKFSGVRDESPARAALMTTLRLAEEYYQDGNMTFAVPANTVSVSRHGDRIVATGKAVVSHGGKGEVQVSLNFGPSGALKPDAIKISGRVLSDVLLR
jgi:hypothetical protein